MTRCTNVLGVTTTLAEKLADEVMCATARRVARKLAAAIVARVDTAKVFHLHAAPPLLAHLEMKYPRT